VRAWELRLGRVSEKLAAWLGVQRRWMYLEAIFSCSDDLRQQLAQVSILQPLATACVSRVARLPALCAMLAPLAWLQHLCSKATLVLHHTCITTL
jgi:hypothetical protein